MTKVALFQQKAQTKKRLTTDRCGTPKVKGSKAETDIVVPDAQHSRFQVKFEKTGEGCD